METGLDTTTKAEIELKLNKYLTLLEMSNELLTSIGGGMLRSQIKGVDGMYDTLDQEARDAYKDQVRFLRKELKRLNQRRKNDLRLLKEAYVNNVAFNKMLLKNFKIKTDKELINKINSLFLETQSPVNLDVADSSK